MKYKIQLLSGVLLLQTFVFAGGMIVPDLNMTTQTVKQLPNIVKKSNFYFGLGRSDMQLKNTLTKENFTALGLTVQLGYSYSQYLSIEGRYMHDVSKVHYTHGSRHQTNANIDISDYPTDFTNIAVYVKPTYKSGNIALYALLGYGEVKLTNIPKGSVDRAESGFQWGLGVSHALSDSVSLYVDYINMYEGKGFDYRAKDADIKADMWTVGFTYKF